MRGQQTRAGDNFDLLLLLQRGKLQLQQAPVNAADVKPGAGAGIVTARSLLKVVNLPEPGGLLASASSTSPQFTQAGFAHRDDMRRQLNLPTGRSISCAHAFNAGRCGHHRESTGDWSAYRPSGPRR
jgi:hypothetical protein